MMVTGISLAEQVLSELKKRVASEGLHPRLAIILASADSASQRYIKKKRKAASMIGASTHVDTFTSDQLSVCTATIQRYNNDPSIHGILVQLPVYKSWPEELLIGMVCPGKDVDGFLPVSPFIEAPAQGVWRMLAEFARIEGYGQTLNFLRGKTIVVVGRGRTAGAPIMNLLQSYGLEPLNVHRSTPDADSIIRSAQVLISAVGKAGIIHAGNTRPDSYVISVGIDISEQEGRIVARGDANEDEVVSIARLFCPTVNGIGPLTVSYLLANLVQAASGRIQGI